MDGKAHWLGFLSQFKKQVAKVEAGLVEKIMTLSEDMHEANKKGSGKDESIEALSEQNAKELKTMKTSIYHLKQSSESNFSVVSAMQKQFREMQEQNSRIEKLLMKNNRKSI